MDIALLHVPFGRAVQQVRNNGPVLHIPLGIAAKKAIV